MWCGAPNRKALVWNAVAVCYRVRLRFTLSFLSFTVARRFAPCCPLFVGVSSCFLRWVLNAVEHASLIFVPEYTSLQLRREYMGQKSIQAWPCLGVEGAAGPGLAEQSFATRKVSPGWFAGVKCGSSSASAMVAKSSSYGPFLFVGLTRPV